MTQTLTALVATGFDIASTLSEMPNLVAPSSTILITRSDLNKSLFIGNHYSYVYGEGQKFESNSASVAFSTRGKMLEINANLVNAQGTQAIHLRFSETQNNILKLTGGTVAKNGMVEDITDVKRLSEVLLCLYRQIRESADKKWAVDFQMKTDAREAAAQLLDTGMLPTFITQDGVLQYNAPKIGKDKICDGQCGKCQLKL